MDNPLEKFDTGQLVAELKRRGLGNAVTVSTDDLVEELEQRGVDPDFVIDGRSVQRLAELIADGDTRDALEKLREICPVAGLPPVDNIIRLRRRLTSSLSEPAHVQG